MSGNQKKGLALAVAGFAVLLLGAAGYIGAYVPNETDYLILMGIGTVAIWASIVLVYFIRDTGYSRGIKMGIVDKIKNAFKKKEKDDGKAEAAEPVSRASNFKGEGKVPDALRVAAAKIDAQVAAGKYNDARGNALLEQLKGVEASSSSEEDKLVNISQIIGGILLSI
ncbi:MAG: hypothetical protein GX137_05850 [Thermoplasmatales archaeon]|jgi:hypothetical protein|nr:hypothetical protein [Thermoplasmatales archaeon]